ncbi:amidohydrolase [Cellulomonas sp. URHB0016]
MSDITKRTNHPVVLTGARRVGGPGHVDVLLRDGRVAAIGTELHAGPRVERIALDGRVLVPGLWDAHTHLTQWALARRRLDVSGARSAAEAASLVARRLADAPPPPRLALVGAGFRDALWPDEPTARVLDEVAGEVPVVLVSGDLHCAWASTAGLRFLGVTHPTGLLREDEWLPLQGVVDHVPDDDADALVADALRAAASRGVVGVVDLELADNLAVWRRRATPAVRVRAGVWEDHLDRVVREDLHTGDRVADLVEQGPFKVITDGSLNTRTAYCHDPYAGTTSPGVLAVPPERLVPLLSYARAHGLRCAVHAIGDAANGLALDAFATTGAHGSIEHAQLLARDDVARFARLDVVASVQPEHAMDDRDVADRHWAGRTDRAFAFGALRRAGVRLALGSDAPVAPLDPWAAIDAAVWRERDGRDPWHPEQRIDVLAALEASVDGRPLALRVGDPADLAVLDEDPLALARTPGALRSVPVAGTIVAGGWAHRAV